MAASVLFRQADAARNAAFGRLVEEYRDDSAGQMRTTEFVVDRGVPLASRQRA
jgi:hypothetical protein